MTIEHEIMTHLQNFGNQWHSKNHITQNLNHQDVIIDYEKAYDILEQKMLQPILTEENIPKQIIKATW